MQVEGFESTMAAWLILQHVLITRRDTFGEAGPQAVMDGAFSSARPHVCVAGSAATSLVSHVY